MGDNLLNARNEYRKAHDLLTQNQIFTIKEIYRVALHLSDESATFLVEALIGLFYNNIKTD